MRLYKIDLDLKDQFYIIVALALASCDHKKCKLHVVGGAEGFWVMELWMRQLKKGRKSCGIGAILLYTDYETFWINLSMPVPY